MASSVTHAYSCPIPDDPEKKAAGNVMQQEHWGAEHVVAGLEEAGVAAGLVAAEVTARNAAIAAAVAVEAAARVAATTKAAILATLGLTEWTITDTTLRIGRLGADAVLRGTTIDLEPAP